MTDWLSVRAEPIEAVEHGIAEASEHFAATGTGPRSFDRIDYPYAMVLPESTERATTTDWRHRISVMLLFEWSRGMDYVDDVLHPLAAVLDETLSALGDVECITDYHPNSIEDFAGDRNNSLLLMVRVRLECLTQLDPGDF